MTTFKDTVVIYVVNLVVINTVSINIIDRITDIAFMCYRYMYLKDVC